MLELDHKTFNRAPVVAADDRALPVVVHAIRHCQLSLASNGIADRRCARDVHRWHVEAILFLFDALLELRLLVVDGVLHLGLLLLSLPLDLAKIRDHWLWRDAVDCGLPEALDAIQGIRVVVVGIGA